MDRNRVHLVGVVREASPCSGAPIPNALVQVLDGPDAGKSSLTDREGLRYGIADVAWGTFRVRASRDGSTSSEVTLNVPATDVVSGPLTQDFAVARTARQALFGEVRERQTGFGPRLAGVRVEVISGPDAGRSTTSDSNGMYRLEQLAAGTPMVRATKAGYVDEVVTASLCGDFRVDIRMTPTNARLEGSVFDTTLVLLSPLEGATGTVGIPGDMTRIRSTQVPCRNSRFHHWLAAKLRLKPPGNGVWGLSRPLSTFSGGPGWPDLIELPQYGTSR
jgi:hypothetical protein